LQIIRKNNGDIVVEIVIKLKFNNFFRKKIWKIKNNIDNNLNLILNICEKIFCYHIFTKQNNIPNFYIPNFTIVNNSYFIYEFEGGNLNVPGCEIINNNNNNIIIKKVLEINVSLFISICNILDIKFENLKLLD